MTTTPYTDQFQQFRQALYQSFSKRADAALDLLDALCSYRAARSPVELSLSPLYRRSHDSLYKAVAADHWESLCAADLLRRSGGLPPPRQRGFWLLGVDVTSYPRPFARTLRDRSYVYHPNAVAGNKPVTVGHQYSTVALLPEAEVGLSPSWVVPLVTERIASDADKELIGAQQVGTLLADERWPWHEELVVEVGDSSYSKPAYLHANRHHTNLVTIVRVRSNRTFYQQFVYPAGKRPAHHPQWYGAAFKLPDEQTWPPADQQARFAARTRRGTPYTVQMEAWHNLLMRGKQKPERIPMHEHPFTLVRVVCYDQAGNPLFKRPLWLIGVGPRRGELSLWAIYEAYRARGKLEGFFRFSKQYLLLTASQTPDTPRETHWWYLVHLAYLMLWMARHLAHHLPRPWERHLATAKAGEISPTLVRRDFARLIRQLGTPARPPQPRGNSPGRAAGTKLPPRPRHNIVVKGQQ